MADALICTACCEQKQDFPCTGCRHYPDADRLFFHCRACGSRSVGEPPSVLAQHLHIGLFPVQVLDGPLTQRGFAVCGESYRTVLEFPFDGRVNEPFWLLAHRAFDLCSMQLIEAEIMQVTQRDRHEAGVEVLAAQVVPFADFPQRFTAHELTCPVPETSDILPCGLSVETEGAHTIWRSTCQDGGAWMVFAETTRGPAITLLAEGWFSHWQCFGGHLRLEQSVYDRLLKEGSQ